MQARMLDLRNTARDGRISYLQSQMLDMIKEIKKAFT